MAAAAHRTRRTRSRWLAPSLLLLMASSSNAATLEVPTEFASILPLLALLLGATAWRGLRPST